MKDQELFKQKPTGTAGRSFAYQSGVPEEFDYFHREAGGGAGKGMRGDGRGRGQQHAHSPPATAEAYLVRISRGDPSVEIEKAETVRRGLAGSVLPTQLKRYFRHSTDFKLFSSQKKKRETKQEKTRK